MNASLSSALDASTPRQERSVFDLHALLDSAGIRATISDHDALDVIFSQGDAADSVFYVQSGKVKVAVVSEEGKEAIVAILPAGSFCGEECLTGHRLRMTTVKTLTEQGVTLVSTSDGIDSSTAAGRMMIGVLGSLAEYERELIKERTALKRGASRANGTKFGRPRKVDDADHIATATRMKSDGHTGKDIAKYLGVSRATLYRYLAEDNAA